MKRIVMFVAIGMAIAVGVVGQALAQEPVIGAKDAEALFTSPDPKLHRNKQIDFYRSDGIQQRTEWLTFIGGVYVGLGKESIQIV